MMKVRPVRDTSKCKEWERRRRDRLTDAFKSLVELLPHYDPARIPAKIDILENSTQFIKELRMSNSRLVASQTQPTEMVRKVKDLQDEVNKLILRVKQLTALLVEAKIPIPIGPYIKSLGKKRRKWTNKLRVENIENIQVTKHALPKSQAPVNELGVKNCKTRITVIVKNDEKDHETPLVDVTKSIVPSPQKVVHTVPKPLAPPTTVLEPRPQPLSFSFQQPTFIFTPIQTQSTPLFTRMNLTPVPALQQQQHSILPKVLLTTSPLQKIPIKAIMKRIPRKIRKPRGKRRTGTKQNGRSAESGSQTRDQTTATSNDADVGGDQDKVISENDQLHESTSVEVTEIPSSMDTPSPVHQTAVESQPPPTILERLTDPDSTPPKKPPSHSDAEKREEVVAVRMGKPLEPPICDVLLRPDDENAANDTICAARELELEEQPNALEEALIGGAETEVILNDPTLIPTETMEVGTAATYETRCAPEGDGRKVMEPSGDFTQRSNVANVGSENVLLPMLLPSNGQARGTEGKSTEVPVLPEEITGPPPPPRVTFDGMVMNLTPPPLPTTSTSALCQSVDEPVSLDTQKMSECIARSIGLMEGSEETEEAELMELGTDWGDVVGVSHSPKSPISPTQMFLSMFPLLPRESLVSVPLEPQSHQSQSQSQQVTLSTPSHHHQHHKSCRSSFFIDSMLPEESQPGVSSHFDPVGAGGRSEVKNKSSGGGGDSLDTILAPLQTLSRDKRTNNEILSLSAFLNLGEPMGLIEPTNSGGKDKADVQLPKNPTLTPLHPLGSDEGSQQGGGFYQNVHQAQTPTHDLFFPSYNHHHHYSYQENKGQQPSAPVPPSSHAQPFHQPQNTPNQTGFHQSGPSYTFRHNYVDTGLDNLHSTPRTNQAQTNLSQQGHAVPKKDTALPHKKTPQKTGGTQQEQLPSTFAHSFPLFVDSNRMSQESEQKTQQQRARPEVGSFTYPQGDQQSRANKSVEERGQAISYSSYATTTTAHGQGQSRGYTFQPAPTFQPHFPQPLPTTLQSGNGANYFNDRLPRPLYAPPASKAPPAPFYLAPHQHQTPPERSGGSSQFPNPQAEFYSNTPAGGVNSAKGGNPPQYNSRNNVGEKQDQGYAQPRPSPQYTQMAPAQAQQVTRRLHATPTGEPGQKKLPNFTAQTQSGSNAGAQTSQTHGQRQRPVNWMTDSPYKKGNPFSVSKLVGAQNTNYGDAVVKQTRNTWNDVQFTPTDLNPPQSHHLTNSGMCMSQYQQPPTQAQPGHSDGYGHQSALGQTPYEQSTPHHHFPPQHQTHFSHHHHHQSTNASNSISNFNLSSIFPEITREKGHGKGLRPSTYYANNK